MSEPAINLCPECGKEYPLGTKYCPEDGSLLTSKKKSTDPFVGKTIAGKYRIIELIGAGGMGAVYKAEHLLLKNIVALKILRSHVLEDEEYLLRFQREARMACRIKHPNAIILHDFGVEEKFPYLVMEFIQGKSLKQLMAEEGPLALDRAFELINQMGGAVIEAHSLGIIHRDLKPENIMVAKRKDGSEWAYVLDFGIAKMLNPDSDMDVVKTQTGQVFGSPRYMSPEQALSQPIDTRADVFSFGILIYELLSNEVPYKAESSVETIYKLLHESPTSLKDARPDLKISDEINAVVMKLIERDREKRHQSIGAFLEEFRRAVPQTVLSHGPTRAQLYGGALVIACVAVGLTYLFSRPEDIDQRSRELRARLEELEELSERKQSELDQAGLLVEQKKKEAEQALHEAERIRDEGEDARRQAEEQKAAVVSATEELDRLRSLRDEEEKNAKLLQLQAEDAKTFAEQKKQEAELALRAAAAHQLQAKEALDQEISQARKEEEQNIKRLRAEAEEAARVAQEKEAAAESARAAAEDQKAQAEEAWRKAEAERLLAEQQQQQALDAKKVAEIQMQEVQKEKEQKEKAQNREATNQRAVEQKAITKADAAVREAENKRKAALREAQELERKKLKAEQELQALQRAQESQRAQEREQAQDRTTEGEDTSTNNEGNETEGNETPTRRLPRQGKRR